MLEVIKDATVRNTIVAWKPTTTKEPTLVPSQPRKQNTSFVSEQLTPSEIESLRQHGREVDDCARTAFARLRAEKASKSKG